MSILIQPNGFYDSKLLHPYENPLSKECSFRIGRPGDQLRQVICFLSGEADRFSDSFCWLGYARFSWHDRSSFSATLGQCCKGVTSRLHHTLAGIRCNAIQFSHSAASGQDLDLIKVDDEFWHRHGLDALLPRKRQRPLLIKEQPPAFVTR